MINNLLKAFIAILLHLVVVHSYSATLSVNPTHAVPATEKESVNTSNVAPPPTFSNCPSNISGITPSNGNCTASVLWVPPNVSGGVGTVTVTSNYNPGESFFPGTHRVIYRATDSNGDTAFCSFNVTVSDFQPPIINVPSDITVSADPGSCGAVVTFPYPSSTDNCPAGTGESPLEQNFDGGEDFSQLCYVFEGAAIGNGGNIDGTNEFETEDLVNFDTRSFMMPLTRFNGAGEIFFDHMIDRGTGNLTMRNSRITVSLVSTGGVITPIFNEQYTNENVQTEYIPITVSGDFYVLFEFDTDDNRGDVAFLDNIYLPGFVVADEADSGQCTAAVRRVVQISGQPFRSGVEFPVGTTTLEYFTRDAVGNINFNSFNVTVTNNINPPVGNSVSYCEGNAIPELSVSTDPTEVADWYDAPSGGNLLIADSNTYTPSGPGTFYVETRNPITGCTSATRTSISLIEDPRPNPPAVTTPIEYCIGDTATQLTATADSGNSLEWFTVPTGGTALASAPTPDTSIAGTTNYYVQQINGSTGCISDRALIEVIVYVIPTAPSVTSPVQFCIGDTAQALDTYATGTNLTWYDAATGGNVIPGNTVPSTASVGTTSFWVTQTTSSANCESPRARLDIEVNNAPTITTQPTDETICENDTATFTVVASSPGSYQWQLFSGGTWTDLSDTAPYSNTTTSTLTITGATLALNGNRYRVIVSGISPSCADAISQERTLTVNPLPTVVANATNTAICAGDTVTLTGSGATSYTWDNGVTDGVAFTPASTTTYTVTGTDGNGCQNTDTITITVNPLPSVTANATSTAICAGDTVTLTGSGATSYTWDNGVTDGVAFTPASTTTYTVTGTDGNGCQNTDTITITVNPLPTVTANASTLLICEGDPVTLTGSGATSYTWDNGVTDGVAFNPTATTTYTVTGTDGNGCENTDTITVTVNPAPTITVSSPPSCSSDLLTYSLSVNVSTGTVTTTEGNVTDNGGNNWTIDNITAGNDITLTVTAGNGCINTIAITAPDCSCPTVNAPTSGGDQTECEANPIQTLTATATPPAGATIVWYDAATGGNVVASPTLNTVGTITYFAESSDNTSSCTSFNRTPVVLTINALPSVVANASATSINAGEPVTLTGSGATTYVWDNGVTDGDTVNPLVTTTYTVAGTDGNGCLNTDSVTITVMPTSDLRLNKTVDNSLPNVGDNVTFTLTVTNDGPTDDAGGSIVNDNLPIGYTYVSDNGNAANGTYTDTTGDWILPAIANGTSVSIDITATVNSPTGTAGEYTNIAQVTTASNFDSDSTPNNDDGDQSEDDEASVSVTPQVTDLEVINTISSSDANPGDVLTISVEVINNGSNDASNIIIDNIVPQGFTVTTINNGGVQTGNTIVWSGMNIANGTSTILTFEVTVNIPTNTADEYLNTVQVMQVDQFDPDSTPNNDDGDQSEDDEDNTFIILIPADLNLTKGLSAASNQNPNAGDTVTFELTVTNDGPGLATNVSIEDQIPSGLTIGTINDGGVLTGNTITWTIPSLAVGSQVVSYEVSINAPANVLDEYRNIAQVTASDQFDPDSTPNNDDGDQSEDDEASFTIPSPTVDIEVVKTVDKAQTFFGDTVVFTIAATNNSTYDATNIGIEDALPTGYSLESVVASHGGYNETISTWEIPLITAGETATLEMTVTVTEIDNYTNIAQLIYVDQIDPNVDNDRDEATPEVTQEECLTVFNEFSPNNDGLNDVFFIECIERYPNNLLQIFNRWGTKVFEMKGYNNTWNGISQGRATVGASEKLPVGTYYYVLDLADGVNKPKTGWLYISR